METAGNNKYRYPNGEVKDYSPDDLVDVLSYSFCTLEDLFTIIYPGDNDLGRLAEIGFTLIREAMERINQVCNLLEQYVGEIKVDRQVRGDDADLGLPDKFLGITFTPREPEDNGRRKKAVNERQVG